MTTFSLKVRLIVVASTALVALLLPVGQASADGPNAVRNLAGCSTSTLPANDDGSTAAIPVPPGYDANFFGLPITQFYVNNNGNITADSAVGQYTPFDFTTAGSAMIAPFLADVDTRGGVSAEVTYGPTTVAGHDALCINWVDVGYFSQHTDKTNSFQLLLIENGPNVGDFDIEMNYDRISWETGDASDGVNGFGGTSAAVGFANGDGDPGHFFVRDGSFENGALLNGGPKALTSGTLNAGGQLGRYVFEVRNGAPTGATVTGEVDEPVSAGGLPVSGAAVEICSSPTDCVARQTNAAGIYRAINLPAGNYTVTAHSAPGGTEYADGIAGPVAVSGLGSFTQDVALGEPLGGVPPGTTLESVGESNDGIPVLHFTVPADLTTNGCANGTATYTVKVDGTTVQTGPMTETPAGSGHYEGTIQPLVPNHGDAVIRIDIDCPNPTPDENVEFNVYIDPSGVVRNAQTGALIPGATVTLFRSATALGPFIQVADGSVTMSAGNRTNPDQTNGGGHFGWDVLAGFYKVRAEAPGCAPAETGALDIPPPVTDLDIGLNCTAGGGSPIGGGGSTVPVAPISAALIGKKCKKGFKLKKVKGKKKCVRKKKRAAVSSRSSWAGLGSTGVLEIGSPEAK